MKILGCPFCGKQPIVEPENPERDGNAWAAVECVNERCVAKPRVLDGALICDERGAAAYKRLAIRRWNRRK
jgi:hypothetical protein